jgi:hypothetical protein
MSAVDIVIAQIIKGGASRDMLLQALAEQHLAYIPDLAEHLMVIFPEVTDPLEKIRIQRVIVQQAIAEQGRKQQQEFFESVLDGIDNVRREMERVSTLLSVQLQLAGVEVEPPKAEKVKPPSGGVVPPGAAHLYKTT